MTEHSSIFFSGKRRIRDFIFIPLAIALAATYSFAKGLNYDLLNVKEVVNSIATSEGIDISKRVAAFYKSFLILAAVFFFSLVRMKKLAEKINEEGLKTINAIAFAISSLFIWQVMQVDVEVEQQLLVALAISTFPSLWKGKFSALNFSFSNLAAFSLFLLIRQIFSEVPFFQDLNLAIYIILFGWTFQLLLNSRPNLINLLGRMSFIPLIIYGLLELPYILASHSIVLSQEFILLGGLAIALPLLIFWKKSNREISLNDFYGFYFPYFLAGFLAMCFFTPTITPKIDWFEDGNRLLPLQQWFQFNRYPLVETFNSHALSDFFPGLIYSWLNHPDPAGNYIYGYLITVTVIVLTFKMIYKITGSGPFAIFFALIYPYADLIFPSYYSLFPLLVLSFIYLTEKRNNASYILFSFTVFFMCIWRVDIGSASLFTAISCLLLYFLIPGTLPKWKDVVKFGAIKIVLLLIVFLIFYFKFGSTIFISAKDALSYLSSFQSYGLIKLSPNADTKYFFLYLIMPVLIFLSACYHYYLLFSGKAKSATVSFGIIFLSVFYIFNFQRGLVRHSLIEGWDTAFTSFGYFILAISFVSNKKLDVKSAAIFLLVATFLVGNYVPGDVNVNNGRTFTSLVKSLNTQKKVKTTSNRIVFNESDKNRYSEFKSWFDKNFSDKATFLDFSNSPMMYYFTGRQLPNYFCQIPHTAHNEFLQKRFLEDLSNYEIPVVVFSSSPGSFWDALDGIPNAIRHPLIAEYIFKNYHPAFILSQHSVWIKNDVNVKNAEKVFSANIKTENILDGSGNISADKNNQLISFSVDSIEVPSVLHLLIRSDLNGKIIFINNGKEISFNLYGGINHLKLPVYENGEVGFILKEGVVAHIDSAFFIQSDVMEDFQSEAVTNYSLKQLPYYAGLKVGSSGEAMDFGNKSFSADKEVRLSFNQASKNSFLEFSASNNVADQDIAVIIGYGKDNEKRGSFDFIIKKKTPVSSYLVPLSSQYNWWKGDNNWISIYPVEQNVMLKNIQITTK